MDDFWEIGELVADTTEPSGTIIGDGLLSHEGLLLITGPPRVRKSFLAANFALALACGHAFAGFKIPEARAVLHISAEGGPIPNRIRLERMWNSVPALPDAKSRFHGSFSWTHRLDTPVGEMALKLAVEKYRPEVLILDSLDRLHGGRANSTADMSKFFGLLRKMMKAHSLAVVLVHHSGAIAEPGVQPDSLIQAEYDSAIAMSRIDSDAWISFDLRHAETPASRRIRFNSKTFWFESEHDNVAVHALHESGSPHTRKTLGKGSVVDGLAGSMRHK